MLVNWPSLLPHEIANILDDQGVLICLTKAKCSQEKNLRVAYAYFLHETYATEVLKFELTDEDETGVSVQKVILQYISYN
jgi:hypothetical protein